MTQNYRHESRKSNGSENAFTEFLDLNAGNDSDLQISDGLSDVDDEQNEDGDDVNDEEETGIFKKELKMPPYEHAKRQLSQLIDLMNGPYLDLSPDYQRDVVWKRKGMRLLIDSMWKGYYIPPVIFNIETVEDENGIQRFKRICVDGKQRLTTIRDFMNGEFPCRINKQAWYFCNPSKRASTVQPRKVLPESAREEFKKIEILCTEYKGLTKRQELEIFQRVQLGIPLSQAEAFRATQGGWQDLAKLYEEEFPDVISLVKQKRASGFRLVLICFIQICECSDSIVAFEEPKLKSTIHLIEVFCSNTATLDAATKRRLRSAFSFFQELVTEDRSTFEKQPDSKKRALAPIELVAICCLVSQKGTERPKGMLRGDVLALRSHLHERYPRLPLTNPCWSAAWEFIDNLESYRGAIDGSTIPAISKQPAKTVKKPLILMNKASETVSSRNQQFNLVSIADKPDSKVSARSITDQQHLSSKTITSHRRKAPNSSSPPGLKTEAHQTSTPSNPLNPTKPPASLRPPNIPSKTQNPPNRKTSLSPSPSSSSSDTLFQYPVIPATSNELHNLPTPNPPKSIPSRQQPGPVANSPPPKKDRKRPAPPDSASNGVGEPTAKKPKPLPKLIPRFKRDGRY